MSENETMPLHLSAVAKVLRSAGHDPAAQGEHAGGFTVGGDIGYISVGYADNVSTPAERSMQLRMYRASLAPFFDVKVLENCLVVTERRSPVAERVDDEELADALRSAYQHGGERTHEAWLAVAKKARELLSR